MTSQTLWGQASFTQAGSNGNAAFTLGNQFSVSQAVPLTGIWWPPQNGVLPSQCAIYDVATSAIVPGTLSTSPAWGAAVNGWQKCSYDGSVILQPGHNYVVAVYCAGGGPNWYPVTNGYWTAGGLGASGITSGVLSAPSSAAAAHGQSVYFSGGAALTFPTSTVTGYNFWADVEVSVPAASPASAALTAHPVLTASENLAVSFVSTDGNGVSTYNVTSPLNNTGGVGTMQARVLVPTAPSSSYPHAFLWMLPVEAGQGTNFGDSIAAALALNAHNAYNLTIIQPGYATDPWLANNPGDPSTQQESFTLAMVAWAKSSLKISGTEQHYLIGFSKSGPGGQALLFRHPSLFLASAAWDAPFGMTAYDGTDPNGMVGGNSAAVYGTNANFTSNYQLSTANLTAWRNASNFGTVNRIWVGGYASFQADTSGYDALLTSLGIQHTFGPFAAGDTHAWHTDWVSSALASIIRPIGVTLQGAAALASAPHLSAAAVRGLAGRAALASAPALGAAARATAIARASLSAAPALTALMPPSGPDLNGLWAAYLAAQALAARAWENYQMMRQAGGTDGTAGFLYSKAYQAQDASDLAYATWQRAQRTVFPGANG